MLPPAHDPGKIQYDKFPKSSKLISITLRPNMSLSLLRVRCLHCSALLFKSNNLEVINVFEGKVLESPVFIEIDCSRCYIVYHFDFI